MIEKQYRNANLGDISEVGRDVHLGDNVNNVFVSEDSDALIRRIDHWLKQGDLATDNRIRLEQWRDTLLKPEGAAQLKRIRYEFQLEEAKLEGFVRDQNNRLKIWLNRSLQRSTFLEQLKQFCKPKEVCPFIFCLSGHAQNDCIEDATEMLQLFYFNEVMRNNSPEINKQKRINDSVYLQTASQAQDALEIILRDLLNLDIFSDCAEILQSLETEFKTQRMVARCKVREWTAEGIKAFFTLWHTQIKRENRYPLLLFLEFKQEDHPALNQILVQGFCDSPAVLLPPLGSIEAQDVIDFYARVLLHERQELRYDAIFDSNSLRTEDTPLYYRDAKNKLQLKYH